VGYQPRYPTALALCDTSYCRRASNNRKAFEECLALIDCLLLSGRSRSKPHGQSRCRFRGFPLQSTKCMTLTVACRLVVDVGRILVGSASAVRDCKLIMIRQSRSHVFKNPFSSLLITRNICHLLAFAA